MTVNEKADHGKTASAFSRWPIRTIQMRLDYTRWTPFGL